MILIILYSLDSWLINCIFVLGLKRKLEINDDEIVANKKVKESNRNDFIIVKLKYEENENPCNTLHRSAGFSKTTISWDFTEESGSRRCNVKLQNSLIHSATGEFFAKFEEINEPYKVFIARLFLQRFFRLDKKSWNAWLIRI